MWADTLGKLFRRQPDRGVADALIAEGRLAEDQGRLREACDIYRRAIASAPRYAKAHVNLGIVLEALGDLDGAIASHETALAAERDDPYANYNLAKLRYARGALREAEERLSRALLARPQFPEALVLQGCVLTAQGRAEAALASFETALQQRAPDFAALYHYALALRSSGRLPQAQAALTQALELDPQNVDARGALADVLSAQGDSAGAASALEAVLVARPDWADALYNYGCMLRKLQRPADAEAALRRAIHVEPTHARAYQMLGGVLLAQSRIAEARELYATARRACPDDFGLASAELFSLLCDERVSDEEMFARHVEFGRRIESRYPARTAPYANTRDPSRRLRIGYVSADFCYHVITLQMLAVLEHHDRSAYQAYCYSTTEAPDAYTRALEERSDVWRAWPSLSEGEMAQAIAADGIDILIDLAGHSGVSQLPVMAQRPAPVQATWIGYVNTTGLTRIDYRISDAIADRPSTTERFHTEALARLPHSQWCWRPFATLAHAPAPPCLRNGYVTFASFHGAMKLSGAVRRLWARILNEVPDSRLVLLGVPKGRAQDALVRDLGAGAERITLVPYVSVQDYMRWFDSVDIVLDTTPYSGANTTCDALFMGVPVVTAPGTRPASRSAASILSAVGLTEWIAADGEGYVRRALAAATDKEVLASLRGSLRARLQSSPVMDEATFTRGLEAAYRRMWQRWCAGLPPQGW
ncbi:MAG TPA: tetratricopeptide repeat protein [Burkholderiales bacterium]|nr:tetratricopeptide repeat protein [Burkholderiales bacterium]